MTDPAELQNLEEAIRRAVLADSFLEARSLIAQYGAHIQQLLRTQSPAPEELLELQRRSRSLLEWSIAMAQASRECAAAELTQLHLLKSYRHETGFLRVRGEA